jgi:segregation and condensation protein A
MTPLGELTVRWTGAEDGEVEIHDEFDGAPPEEGAAAAAELGEVGVPSRPEDEHSTEDEQ